MGCTLSSMNKPKNINEPKKSSGSQKDIVGSKENLFKGFSTKNGKAMIWSSRNINLAGDDFAEKSAEFGNREQEFSFSPECNEKRLSSPDSLRVVPNKLIGKGQENPKSRFSNARPQEREAFDEDVDQAIQWADLEKGKEINNSDLNSPISDAINLEKECNYPQKSFCLSKEIKFTSSVGDFSNRSPVNLRTDSSVKNLYYDKSRKTKMRKTFDWHNSQVMLQRKPKISPERPKSLIKGTLDLERGLNFPTSQSLKKIVPGSASHNRAFSLRLFKQNSNIEPDVRNEGKDSPSRIKLVSPGAKFINLQASGVFEEENNNLEYLNNLPEYDSRANSLKDAEMEDQFCHKERMNEDSDSLQNNQRRPKIRLSSQNIEFSLNKSRQLKSLSDLKRNRNRNLGTLASACKTLYIPKKSKKSSQKEKIKKIMSNSKDAIAIDSQTAPFKIHQENLNQFSGPAAKDTSSNIEALIKTSRKGAFGLRKNQTKSPRKRINLVKKGSLINMNGFQSTKASQDFQNEEHTFISSSHRELKTLLISDKKRPGDQPLTYSPVEKDARLSRSKTGRCVSFSPSPLHQGFRVAKYPLEYSQRGPGSFKLDSAQDLSPQSAAEEHLPPRPTVDTLKAFNKYDVPSKTDYKEQLDGSLEAQIDLKKVCLVQESAPHFLQTANIDINKQSQFIREKLPQKLKIKPSNYYGLVTNQV